MRHWAIHTCNLFGFHMRTRYRMRFIQTGIAGSFLFLALPAALADDWPVAFAKLSIPSSAHGGVASEAPASDCQPESFDPQATKYRPSGSKDASPATYLVEGADETVTMTIDSRDRQDDAKTTLPQPYSVTRYIFKCGEKSSEVLEFRKDNKRYALYTHVSQAKFSPDMKKLVLYNRAKPHHGSWQSLRRVFDIRTRRFTDLPMINETSFLADVGNDRIVTYALQPSKQDPHRRIAAIWGMDGKLIQALSVPAPSATADQPNSSEAFGLLPDDPATFYHLARTGEGECTLRLQDIRNTAGRRVIRMAVPGAATDPADVGMRVQIDLSGLTLKGGSMKYRVSASGKGNIAGDWGPWQTAE